MFEFLQDMAALANILDFIYVMGLGIYYLFYYLGLGIFYLFYYTWPLIIIGCVLYLTRQRNKNEEI